MFHVCSHGEIIESVADGKGNGMEIQGFRCTSDESGTTLRPLNHMSPSEMYPPSFSHRVLQISVLHAFFSSQTKTFILTASQEKGEGEGGGNPTIFVIAELNLEGSIVDHIAVATHPSGILNQKTMKWKLIDGPVAVIWDEYVCVILACLQSGDFVTHSCRWVDWKPHHPHDASARDFAETDGASRVDQHHNPFIVIDINVDHVGKRSCEMHCIIAEGLGLTSKQVHFKRRMVSWEFDASIMIHVLDDLVASSCDHQFLDIGMDLKQEKLSEFPKACIAKEWESRRSVHMEQEAKEDCICVDSVLKGWSFSIGGMNLLHIWDEEHGERSIPLCFEIEWMECIGFGAENDMIAVGCLSGNAIFIRPLTSEILIQLDECRHVLCDAFQEDGMRQVLTLSHQESDGSISLGRCLSTEDMDQSIGSGQVQIMKDALVQCNDVMSRLDTEYAILRTDIEDAAELRDVELSMLTNVGKSMGIVARHGILPSAFGGLRPSEEIGSVREGIATEKDSISMPSFVITRIDHEIYEWDVIVFYLYVQNNAESPVFNMFPVTSVEGLRVDSVKFVGPERLEDGETCVIRCCAHVPFPSVDDDDDDAKCNKFQFVICCAYSLLPRGTVLDRESTSSLVHLFPASLSAASIIEVSVPRTLALKVPSGITHPWIHGITKDFEIEWYHGEEMLIQHVSHVFGMSIGTKETKSTSQPRVFESDPSHAFWRDSCRFLQIRLFQLHTDRWKIILNASDEETLMRTTKMLASSCKIMHEKDL